MSFADERREALIKRNNENKRRARQMEQRVAKYLKGNRIPMSGAGSIKGDCMVMRDRLGMILIECKTSAAVDKYGNPQIRIDFRWLEKLAKDVKSTNAKMGVLVFHYKDGRTDYVIVDDAWYVKLAGKPIAQAVTFYGDKRNGTIMKQAVVEKALADGPEGAAKLSTQYGDYTILTLPALRDLLDRE